MADLQETLEKREQRSRLVSFLVGSAVILAIIVGVVWFNNRGNNSGEVVDDGVSITATEDSDTDSESSDSDHSNSTNTTDTASNDADSTDDDETETENETEQISAVATAGNSDGELPNTGPEQAVIGVISVAIAAQLFIKTRSNLDNTLRS